MGRFLRNNYDGSKDYELKCIKSFKDEIIVKEGERYICSLKPYDESSNLNYDVYIVNDIKIPRNYFEALPKSLDEINSLKEDWKNDPCWDIEDTVGFEGYIEELKAYRLECQKKWCMDEKARELGVEGIYRLLMEHLDSHIK